MNTKDLKKILKNLGSDSVETALPYVIDMLPNVFMNGICVSLPTIGNICLSFKQNRDARILTERIQKQEEELGILKEKVKTLCNEEKMEVYKILVDICRKEIEPADDEASRDIYKVDYMGLILDDKYEYCYERFNDFIDNLENAYIISDAGYVWITGNRITINIDGHITRYSEEFHEIIEYVNDLLVDVGVSGTYESIKSVKCF